MTPFSILTRLAGLSLREAAEFHKVRLDTAKSWSSGRNECPARVLDELRGLIDRQENSAAFWTPRKGSAIFLDEPGNDAEAQSLGWPCVGAWGAMAGRVLAKSHRAVIVRRDAAQASDAKLGTHL